MATTSQHRPSTGREFEESVYEQSARRRNVMWSQALRVSIESETMNGMKAPYRKGELQ